MSIIFPNSDVIYNDLDQTDQSLVSGAIKMVADSIADLSVIPVEKFQKEDIEYINKELIYYWDAMTKVNSSARIVDEEFYNFYSRLFSFIQKLDFPIPMIEQLRESMKSMKKERPTINSFVFNEGEKEKIAKFNSDSGFFTGNASDLSVTQINLINLLVSSGFLSSVRDKILKKDLKSDCLKYLVKIYKYIFPYIDVKYAVVIAEMLSDAAIDCLSVDQKNAKPICSFLSDNIKLIQEKAESILKMLCSIKSENTINIRFSILNAICKIVKTVGICNSGENVKECLLEAAFSQKSEILKLALDYLPNIAHKTPITAEDISSLYKATKNGDADAIFELIIALLNEIDQKMDLSGIAEDYSENKRVNPSFSAALIERIPSEALQEELFNHMLSDTSILQSFDFGKLPYGKNLKRLMQVVTDETEDDEKLSNLAYVYLGCPKHENIIQYLTKIISRATESPLLLKTISNIAPIASKLSPDAVYLKILEQAFRSIGKGNMEATTKMFTVLSEWTDSMRRIPFKSVTEVFLSTKLSPFPDEVPYFVNSILSKMTPSNRDKATQILMKLLDDTVPQRHSLWLTKTILNNVYCREQSLKEFVSTLFHIISIPEKKEATVEVLLNAAKLEADFFRPTDSFGYDQAANFSLFDGTKSVKTVHSHISLHPFHSARRLYFVSSLLLEQSPSQIAVNQKDDISEFEFKFISPLSSLALDHSKEIDFVVYPLREEFNIDSIINTEFKYISGAPFLTELMQNQNYLETLFSQMVGTDETSQKLFQVLSLFEGVFIPRISMEPIQHVFSKNITSIIPFENMISVIPYAAKCICEKSPKDETIIEVINTLPNMRFDTVSSAMICKALNEINTKCIFTEEMIRRCLLESDDDNIKAAIAGIISTETPSNYFISLLPLTTNPEYRSRTETFYKILEQYDINPEIYACSYKDLCQFEVSHYADIDQTFIGLLKLIPNNEEMLKLTISRLFSPPVCRSLNTPFIHTIESWAAAFAFISKPEALKFLIPCFNNLPSTPNQQAKLSEDFTYKGRCGIQNLGSTCYASSVLQALNTYTNVINKLLSLNPERLSPILMNLRIFFSQLLFTRGNVLSVRSILDCSKNFGEKEQHDVEEFYSFIINKMKEDLGSDFLLEDLTGTMVNLVCSENKEIMSESETNFYLIPLMVSGFNNIYEGLADFSKPNAVQSDGAVQSYHITKVKKWPNYLTIQLDRIGYNLQIGISYKIKDEVKFPIILQRQAIINTAGSDPGSNYRLTGVVVHNGSVERGHYIALVEGNDNDWYECDDDKIKYFYPEQIQPCAFGGKDNTDQHDNCLTAYLLFYKKTDLEESKPEVPSDLEETLDMENMNAWPTIVLFSTRFIEFALDMLKKYPTNELAIELATIAVFKVGVAQDSLYQWCQTLEKVCLISQENCLTFIRIINRSISETQLPLLISMTDYTAVELGHTMIQAISNITDTTEGIVLALKAIGQASMKRCIMLCYELISTSISVLNVDWFDEDDALLLMVQRLVNDNPKESIKPSGRSVFQAVNSISLILSEIIEKKGVTDAMLAFLDPQVILRMACVLRKSENFIMFMSACISHLPSIYVTLQEKLSKSMGNNNDLQSLLKSVTANGILISYDISDLNLDFFWDMVPPLLFNPDKSVRETISNACIKLLRIPDQKVSEFYSTALLQQEKSTTLFVEGSSSVLFFIGLIPRIKQLVETRKTSLTFEATKLVFAAATMSPSSVMFFADDIYDIIRVIPDNFLLAVYILILHHIVAYDRSFSQKIPDDIVDIILRMDHIPTQDSQVSSGRTNEDKLPFNIFNEMKSMMQFVVVFKSKANNSRLSGLCITKLLQLPCGDFCIKVKDMLKNGEFVPGPFIVPPEAPGIGNATLALELWKVASDEDIQKNGEYLRTSLERYMITSLNFAKPIILYKRIPAVKEMLDVLDAKYHDTIEEMLGK